MARAFGRRLRETKLGSMAGRVPVWAWLAVLVVGSAVFRFQLSRDSPGPWIFVDELIYSELAKSIAGGGDLLIRDVPASGYGVVYPLLISPAWALFDRIPDAYTAAKAINAVLISLAAVPAYLLARRLVGEGLSLLAAVLAVALPSLAYSGVIMTENAFYPLFLVVVLSLVLVLERPTLTRQIVLVGLLGVAYQTRPQAVALAAAALTAPLVQGLLGRRVRAALVAQRTLYGIAGAAVVLVVALQLVRGQSFSSLLGAYAVVGEGGYHLGAVVRYFLYHAAELDLYLGVAPVVAAALVVVCMRNTDPRLDAYLAAAISVSFWLLLLVAIIRVEVRRQDPGAQRLLPRTPSPDRVARVDRKWCAAARPGDRGSCGRRSGAPGHPAVSPPDRFSGDIGDVDAPAAIRFGRPRPQSRRPLRRCGSGGDRCRRARALSATTVRACAPVLVLVYFLVALHPIERRMTDLSQRSVYSGVSNPHRDWIDRAVPAGAEVSVLWTGEGNVYTVWQNEFFSRSVGTIYSIAGQLLGALPQTRLSVDAHAGILRGPDGRPVRPRYLLVDDSFTPAGRVVARDEVHRITLYELEGPLHSTEN